jgi:hypothetical protein
MRTTVVMTTEDGVAGSASRWRVGRGSAAGRPAVVWRRAMRATASAVLVLVSLAGHAPPAAGDPQPEPRA